MRRLFPDPVDPVDPVEVYGDLPLGEGRPAVRLNMIASLDGATALDGTSGGLGGAADRRVFAVLRALADVVLVAAGTVRAEGYRPTRAPGPVIAVVTRSANLDWESPLFRGPGLRPLVVSVGDAPPERLARAAERAEVILAGEGRVDLTAALAALGARGARQVLLEGGPSLNGAMAAAGLLDELCLTVAPRLAGGAAKRILDGPPLPGAPALALRSVCEEDGFLFLRHRPG